MSAVVAVYVAIGAAILALELSDDYIREDVAQMERWRQFAYVLLSLFAWPLLLIAGMEE